MKWGNWEQTEPNDNNENAPEKEWREERFVVFTGNGGIGKTRFLQELERKEIERMQTRSVPEYLPLYLEARQLEGIKTLEALIPVIAGELAKVFRQAGKASYSQEKLRALVGLLLQEGKLFPLVDAFDQLPNNQETVIADILVHPHLFGECRRFLSTRPGDLKSLQTNIRKAAMDPDTVRIVWLHPFTDEQLQDYFGQRYREIDELHARLASQNSGREGRVGLLHVPLLARYLKTMLVRGKRFVDVRSRSAIMEQFVDHIIKEQVEKYRVNETTPVNGLDAQYSQLKDLLGCLALETVADERRNKFVFNEKRVRRILGATDYATFTHMRQAEFVRPFLDDENRPLFRFQHQLLQEFSRQGPWPSFISRRGQRLERLFGKDQI